MATAVCPNPITVPNRGMLCEKYSYACSPGRVEKVASFLSSTFFVFSLFYVRGFGNVGISGKNFKTVRRKMLGNFSVLVLCPTSSAMRFLLCRFALPPAIQCIGSYGRPGSIIGHQPDTTWPHTTVLYFSGLCSRASR